MSQPTNSHFYRVLYKRNKDNSIQVWKIWTENNIIYTEHGKMDGKQQRSTKEIQGKNIGKKNETTGTEQAEFEAESMWKKKKDKGYLEDLEATRETTIFLPMLASDFRKREDKVVYSAYVQPKLDGVRCLAFWKGNKVELLSRGGKSWILPHLSEEIANFLKPDQVLDGEIYIHGKTFQEITKLVKKDRGEPTRELQLWVYDSFYIKDIEAPFSERLKLLEELDDVLPENTNIRVVNTNIVYDSQSVNRYEVTFVKSGFEGAIVREAHGTYELGHRSRHLLKVKSFMDDEYKVTGFTDGQGKFENCVVWICETEKGQTFKVVPKGTLEEKKELFKTGENYVDKWLKVKFFELTDDGIPRFPVGIGFRPEKDM